MNCSSRFLRGPAFRAAGLVLIVVTAGVRLSAAEPVARELFIPAANADLAGATQSALARIRSLSTTKSVKVVKIDPAAFSGATENMMITTSPDSKFISKLFQRAFGEHQLLVSLPKPGGESSLFVKHKGGVYGLILQGTQVTLLKPIGGGFHALVETDRSKLPPEHPAVFKETEKRKVARALPVSPHLRPLSPKADAPALPMLLPAEIPVIRVLVAYSPQAGTMDFDLEALAQLSVEATNRSFANSGVRARVELAGMLALKDDESGNFETDLANFMGQHDGKMDEVHAKRDELKADVCMLFVKNSDYGGLSAAILASESTAFSVVSVQNNLLYFSFPHELGHLLGARHDADVDPEATPFSDGHGYVCATGAQPWRTIMAYSPPGTVPRILYWANPALQRQGMPMGVAGVNNDSRVLSLTAPIVAAFR